MAGVRVVWIVCGCCPFDSYPLEWLPNNRRVSCCVPSWRALASACLGQIGCRGTQPHRVPGVLNAASPICWAVASRLEAIGRCCRGGRGRGADRRRGLLGRQVCPARHCPDGRIWHCSPYRTAHRIPHRTAQPLALDNAGRRGFPGVCLDTYVAALSASCDSASCDSASCDSARRHPDASPNFAAEVRRACSGGLLLPVVP